MSQELGGPLGLGISRVTAKEPLVGWWLSPLSLGPWTTTGPTTFSLVIQKHQLVHLMYPWVRVCIGQSHPGHQWAPGAAVSWASCPPPILKLKETHITELGRRGGVIGWQHGVLVKCPGSRRPGFKCCCHHFPAGSFWINYLIPFDCVLQRWNGINNIVYLTEWFRVQRHNAGVVFNHSSWPFLFQF